MPLAQINLKLPPEVLEEWRRRAAEGGHRSVQAWLIATLQPDAVAEAPPGLADRVSALEAELSSLRAAVAALPAPGPPPASRPRPVPPAPAALPASGQKPIETAALADLLGMKRSTLNAAIARHGGARPGLELNGWRCLGTRPSPRGGPDRAVWVPADTRSAAEIQGEAGTTEAEIGTATGTTAAEPGTR